MCHVKNQVEQILFIFVLYSPQNREGKWSRLWNYMGVFTANERWSSYLQSSSYGGKRFRIQTGMCPKYNSIDTHFHLFHFYVFSMQDLTTFIFLIQKHLFSAYYVPKNSNYTVYQDSKSLGCELHLNRVFVHLTGIYWTLCQALRIQVNKKSLPPCSLHSSRKRDSKSR